MKTVFTFKGSRCSGCMACITACRDQNDWEPEDAFRRVVRSERGVFPEARITFVSASCRHCDDAPCLDACPAGAIFRDEALGIIDVDRTRCTGCGTCAAACPFDAPRFLPDGTMAKCDFCRGRITRGLEPACVRVCPTGALGFKRE